MKRHRNTVTPHCGQIVSSRKAIISFIRDIDTSVTFNAVYLLSSGLNAQDDYLRLFATCLRLYYLSRLIYKGKSGIYRKLLENQYIEYLFDSYAESPEEVLNIMINHNGDRCASMNEADSIHKNLMVLKNLWCRAIACVDEQIYIPELAYEFDYVLKNTGRLPAPEYESRYSFFPVNYVDFDYTEGIAEYFENVMGSIV